MGRNQHAFFKDHPLDGQVTVGEEILTTPYLIYDGFMLLHGGTVDAQVASQLLENEELMPLLDTNGRALAAIWVCDFSDANLGPHQELQISLFATFRSVSPIKAHPFAIFRALMKQPDTQMVCHGLWNNTARVVHYNREYLALNAQPTSGVIKRADGRVQFRFADAAGNGIAEGDIAVAPKPSLSVLGQMTRCVGVSSIMRSLISPTFHTRVVNTRRNGADRNLVAHTYCQSDRQTIRHTGAPDWLQVSNPRYAALNFTPEFVQLLDGVRFAYLRPEAPVR